MKVERVSYDVMTPSAAVGLLSAIYSKPEMTWAIDKIYVVKPVRFLGISRNETKGAAQKEILSKIKKGKVTQADLLNINNTRTQRHSLILKNVEYVIEASIVPMPGHEKSLIKHKHIFARRARKGQYFHQPYFGCREYTANFELVSDVPQSAYIGRIVELGRMLNGIDYNNKMTAVFFDAVMIDGVISPPRIGDGV